MYYSVLATSNSLVFKPLFVAKQAGLSIAWSKSLKTGFLATSAHMILQEISAKRQISLLKIIGPNINGIMD